MKKLFFTLATIISITNLSAQRIEVKEESTKFSTGTKNALITTIYSNTKDNVEGKWKTLLNNYKNEKVKSGKNELFADNIIVKEWGNNPVDIYTTFEEDKKTLTVKMYVGFDLGGVYLSSEQKDKYPVAEKIIRDFAIKMTQRPLEEKVKDTEKILEKAENNQKDLKKANKSLKSDIEDYKEKITKTKKEIITKEAEIENKKSEVSIQKKVVNASSDAVSEQAKSAQKIYNKLLGQQKDLEKENKNLESDIESYNTKIKKSEESIKKNEAEQIKKKTEIETHKKALEEVKAALNKVN